MYTEPYSVSNKPEPVPCDEKRDYYPSRLKYHFR